MHVAEEIAPTEMGQSAPFLEGTSVPIVDESGSPLRLRCFVRKGGERGYVAECIDLDLGAESETLTGAVKGLNDAMIGYLMVVLDGIETDQEPPAVVLRPSPLSHRVQYNLGYMKYRIAAFLFGRHRHSTKKFYSAPYGLGNLPCHSH